MSEKTLEKKLRETIKSRKGLALKIWSTSFTGLPDRLVLMPGGYTYFAEIKTTGKKPTTRQLKVHDVLRELGFKVFVIDSNESLQRMLEEIEK